MKVVWLVECFDENKEAFHKAVKDAGHALRIAQPFEYVFQGEFASELSAHKGPVVFYGSIGFAKSVLRSDLLPGAYYHNTGFNCSNYYPLFHEHMLNQEYMMLPWYAIPKNKDKIFSAYGNNGCVFMRPNSGDKTFTGYIFTQEKWDEELRRAGFYDPNPQDICLIAEPQNIYSEWRFVVVKGQIVAGSRYKLMNELCTGEADSSCFNWQYAQSVVDDICSKEQEHWEVPRCWCIDTCCLMNGERKVVEVGCFSCAGLYDSNLDIIVNAVSNAAIEEWNEYQDV